MAWPIYRLFKNKAFEPEAISTMTRTYAEVCRTLGLSDGDRPETGVEHHEMVARTRVAKTVIEYAQRGARDHNAAARLRAAGAEAVTAELKVLGGLRPRRAAVADYRHHCGRARRRRS